MAGKTLVIAAILLLGIGLNSCDKFEFRGFVSSYELVNERFEQSMEWNSKNPETNLEVSTDEYKIFAMGDSHLGTANNFKRYIEDAVKDSALAAVMVGDVSSGHKEDLLYLKENMPDPNRMHTFLMVGNHDLYFDGWKTFYQLFGSSSYYFTVTTPTQKDIFICMDSGSGTLGSKQLEWFKDLLENHRSAYRNCIVFTHNNLFRVRRTASTNPPIEELYVLSDLCLKHKINMVITGHDHARNVVQFGNTVHITMDALLDGYKNAGYFVLSVKQDALDHEFVKL